MANPVQLDELSAAGSLSAGAAVAVVQGNDTFRTTPQAFITEAQSYIQQGSGTVPRAPQDKMRDAKHVYDLGCACDSSTDDYSKINTYILTEVAEGRTPWLEFPPGTTTMVSQALPFRDNIGYFCRSGWATIKAHSTSTDNVMGEATPSAAYSQPYVDGIIIDGNRANVAYNTRNAGATDDAYQNGIRLNQVSKGWFRVRVKEAVFNGISVYNISSDNTFLAPRATDIGKSTSIVSGAASYNGIFVEFGCDRNKFINPYINTTRDHGIWETGQGADNYDNEYINAYVIAAGGDGIRIADDQSTNTTHRPKIINPVVLNCTAVGAVGIRLSPNAGGAIDDALILTPHVESCTNGIVLQGGAGSSVNRPKVIAPTIRSSTTNNLVLAAPCVDAVIIGGSSLGAGSSQFSDSGTRTIRYGLIVDTTGTFNTNVGITASGDITRTGSSGNTLQFLLNQSGVVQWYLKNLATTGMFSIGSGGLGDMISITTAGAMSFGNSGNSIGFYGATPVAKQLLATGAGRTVDDVITALQQLGLVKQS